MPLLFRVSSGDRLVIDGVMVEAVYLDVAPGGVIRVDDAIQIKRAEQSALPRNALPSSGKVAKMVIDAEGSPVTYRKGPRSLLK